MNGFRRSAFISAICGVALVWGVVTPVAEAAENMPFTVRFTANANGSIVSIGNTVLTCPTTASYCTNARDGDLDHPRMNNDYSLVYVDADADPSTFNSSMAGLNLPEGFQVLWAGLYWGAGPGSGDNNKMLFKLPGETDYRTITASTLANAQFGITDGIFQRFADVTSLVQQAGNGPYWGANINAKTGNNGVGGWSLTVAYTAPGQALRNLTVFDGFTLVDGSHTPTVQISGFRTPLSGPVVTTFHMLAWEGDLQGTSANDYTSLNGTKLATNLSKTTDFFNSSIDMYGVSYADRLPAYRNNMSIDVKNVSLTGILGNNATSATFQFVGASDTYVPGMLAFAIDLYAPNFTPSTKTAEPVGGHNPPQPGDVLLYTVNYTNVGDDMSAQTVSVDPLPAGTQYVPGSLRLLTASGSVPLTDAEGDDVGEFLGDAVQVRLGPGSNATTGGDIPIEGSAGYTFQVRLTGEATVLGSVTNLAHVHYVADTTKMAATYDIQPATTLIAQPADLAITKSIDPRQVVTGAGETVTSTLTITNNGPGEAIGVVVTDPIIDGLTGVAVDVSEAPGASCQLPPGGVGTVSCDLADMSVGDSVVIKISGTVPAGVPDDQLVLNNVAQVSSTISYDPNLEDNEASDVIDLDRMADLVITKTPTSPTVAPGDRVSYALTVTNNGPSNATELLISDLPSQPLSLVSAGSTTSGVDCQITDDTAECSLDKLAAGESAVVDVVAKLPRNASVGSPLQNTATVTSTTPDPDEGSNTAVSAGTVGPPQSDLRLTKSVSSDPVTAGTGINYTLTVVNYGPSDAAGVVVTDPLPATVLEYNVESDKGSCQVVQHVVTCQIGNLAAGDEPGQPGASAAVRIQAVLDPDALNSVANTASTNSSSGDPDPSNSTTTATAQVITKADVSVVMTADTPNLPNAGDKVTYEVVVHNAGPSTARQVAISELLPDGVVIDPNDPPDLPAGVTCNIVNGAWVCQIGDVELDQDVVLHLHTVATRDSDGPLTATTTVTTSTDPVSDDIGGHTATWTLSEDPQSDLSITVEPVGDFDAGQTGLYKMVVSNSGSPNSSVPTVTNVLPDGVTLLPPGAGSQTTPGCTASGQTVTCVRPTALGADQTWEVLLSVAVSPDIANGTQLTDEVTVHGSSTDPTDSNNHASATVTVGRSFDLRLSKTVDQANGASGLPLVEPGQNLTYILTVVNAGRSTAPQAVVTDTLPAGLSLVAAQSPGCSVVTAGNMAAGRAETVACQVGSLASGQSQTFQLVVTVALAGWGQPGCAATPAGCGAVQRQIVNTAVVVANGPDDADPANDTATAAVVVDLSADLRVSLVPSTGTVDAGDDLTYQLTVVNDGPGIIDSPYADVSFPPGFVIESWDIPQANCQASHGGNPDVYTLHCEAAGPDGPALSPGQSFTGSIRVSTPVDPLPTPYLATAGVGGDTTQNNHDNDTVTAAGVTVRPVSDVTVDTHLVGNVVSGQPSTWQVTATNHGPSTAKDAVINYAIPDGMTFVSATGGPGTICSQPMIGPTGSRTIQCHVGDLPDGASTSVDVVLVPDPSQAGQPVCGTATVNSDSYDPTLDNQNYACETVGQPTAPDVKVSISADQTTVEPGGTSSFTAVVRNDGDGGANGVTAVFDLPDGLTDVTGVLVSSEDGTIHDATCVVIGRQLACTVGDLKPGESVSYRITGKATGEAGSQQTLTVNNLPTDQGASVEILDPPAPDLRVTKTVDGPKVAAPGDVLTYTLTFTNRGDGTAVVSYIDDLSGLLDDADLGEILAGTGLTVTRDANGRLLITGEVPPGQTVTVVYKATIKPDGQRGDDLVFEAAYPSDTPEADRPTLANPRCPDCTLITVRPAPAVTPPAGQVSTGGQVVKGWWTQLVERIAGLTS